MGARGRHRREGREKHTGDQGLSVTSCSKYIDKLADWHGRRRASRLKRGEGKGREG